MPVNKFERVISEDNAWREVLVDIDEEREGELRYVISRKPLLMSCKRWRYF